LYCFDTIDFTVNRSSDDIEFRLSIKSWHDWLNVLPFSLYRIISIILIPSDVSFAIIFALIKFIVLP
jgi:hypothetical protein